MPLKNDQSPSSSSGDGKDSEAASHQSPQELLNGLESINGKSQWSVPIGPEAQFPLMIKYCTELALKDEDMENEVCRKFYDDFLAMGFFRVMMENALNEWRADVLKYIFQASHLFIDLLMAKMDDDCSGPWEAVHFIFSPQSRFHQVTCGKSAEAALAEWQEYLTTYGKDASIKGDNGVAEDGEMDTTNNSNQYAKCGRRAYLANLIDYFGSLGGFQMLKDRLSASNKDLTVKVLFYTTKLVSSCAGVVTNECVEEYIQPCVDGAVEFLHSLSDVDLKKTCQTEVSVDHLNNAIRSLRLACSRVGDDLLKRNVPRLEAVQLRSFSIILADSPFNCKMTALKEINRFTLLRREQRTSDDVDWLTPDRLVEWVVNQDIISIVLRDNLHQSQYVEKVERLVHFLVQKKSLTKQHLSAIWKSQIAKHEAIVSNVHDLLIRMAWDFDSEQLDHLFSCFEAAALNAPKKSQENLLRLISNLAEDDKNGVMAAKVLNVQWNLAYDINTPPDVVEQAVSGLVVVLNFTSTHDTYGVKFNWVKKCFKKLEGGVWVLRSLRLMQQILITLDNRQTSRTSAHGSDREAALMSLSQDYRVMRVIAKDLDSYLVGTRANMPDAEADYSSKTYKPDGRYSHHDHVWKRLDFIRFVLRDGGMYLDGPLAQEIWRSLMEHNVFSSDRDVCMQWFGQLLHREPDITKEVGVVFMEEHLLHLEPSALTEIGFRCFERFFRLSNGWIIEAEQASGEDNVKNATERSEPLGWAYLWELLEVAGDTVADRATAVMRDAVVLQCNRPTAKPHSIRKQFVDSCISRLERASQLLLAMLSSPAKAVASPARQALFFSAEVPVHHDTEAQKCVKLCTRIVVLLCEFVRKCDSLYEKVRSIMPHVKSARGDDLTITVRYHMHMNLPDDEIHMHQFSSIGHLRAAIQLRMRAKSVAMDPVLSINQTQLRGAQDNQLLEVFRARDKLFVSVSPPGRPLQETVGMDSPVTSSDNDRSPGSDSQNRLRSEDALPGVMLSKRPQFVTTVLNIMDSTTFHGYTNLTQSCQALLSILPTDPARLEQLKECLSEEAELGDKERSRWTNDMSSVLRSCFVDTSPAKALYNLEVLQTLILPSFELDHRLCQACQEHFVRAGGLSCLVTLLTGEGFLEKAGPLVKQPAQRVVLRLCKFFFTATARARVHRVLTGLQENLLKKGKRYETDLVLRSPEAQQLVEDSVVSAEQYEAACHLEQALEVVPHPFQDTWLRAAATEVGISCPEVLSLFTPSLHLLECVRLMAWRAGISAGSESDEGTPAKVHASMSEFPLMEPCPAENVEDETVARDSLQVLSLLTFLQPDMVDSLILEDPKWMPFITDMLLKAETEVARVAAVDNFFHMLTRGLSAKGTANFVIDHFFNVLDDLPTQPSHGYNNFFHLFSELLSNGGLAALNGRLDERLQSVIAWLDQTRVLARCGSPSPTTEALVVGYLSIARCLVQLLPPAEKEEIGVGGVGLIKKLLEDFLFPCSYSQDEKVDGKRDRRSSRSDVVNAICQSPAAQTAAFSVLVELCSQCVKNVVSVCTAISNLFYCGVDIQQISEWDYCPNVNFRAPDGYVGLRNGGATCYMNAVLQTLFMIPPIRNTILAAHNAGWDDSDDALARPDKELSIGSPASLLNHLDLSASPSIVPSPVKVKDKEPSPCSSPAGTPVSHDEKSPSEHLALLRHLQHTFGQLLGSKAPSYEPVGFWKTFKVNGERVPLREQFDALEFLNSLTDRVDEALGELKQPKAFEETLHGTFADQKICKTCPHRYSREEPFSSVALNIQNCRKLTDSLAEYVKGDLLEGGNQYHCEKCDKKVDAVKRLCLDKLPKVLTFQLKRFQYDWERECAVKFNDYFEFPRELDMYPYTAQGMAEAEGEEMPMDCTDTTDSRNMYSLCAVVVHHGQASTGHYYSFVKQKCANGTDKWCRFDDMEVGELSMTDKDMKEMFFGGELGNNLVYKRQKRWFSAYLLFYERNDVEMFSCQQPSPELPLHVVQAVRQGNKKHAHQRSHFCVEFFTFMRDMLMSCTPKVQLPSAEDEEIMLPVMELVSKFLFAIGLRCKKSLRGSAEHWLGSLMAVFSCSHAARTWFASNVLFKYPQLFTDFLLDCPQADARYYFARMLAHLSQVSLHDGAVTLPNLRTTDPVNGSILEGIQSPFKGEQVLLVYIEKAVQLVVQRAPKALQSRALIQCLDYFIIYGDIGGTQMAFLAQLGTAQFLICYLMKELRSNVMQELVPVHSFIARLLPYHQVPETELNSNSTPQEGKTAQQLQAENPFAPKLATIPFSEALYRQVFQEGYIDRLLGDLPPVDNHVRRLLCYLSWECPALSHTIILGLMNLVLRCQGRNHVAYLDTICAVMALEDSWQRLRAELVLAGGENRDGLFAIFKKTKSFPSDRKRLLRTAKACVYIVQKSPIGRDIVLQSEPLTAILNLLVTHLADTLKPPKKPWSYLDSNASLQQELSGEESEVAQMVVYCKDVLAGAKGWQKRADASGTQAGVDAATSKAQQPQPQPQQTPNGEAAAESDSDGKTDEEEDLDEDVEDVEEDDEVAAYNRSAAHNFIEEEDVDDGNVTIQPLPMMDTNGSHP